jgi:hypothetical protein
VPSCDDELQVHLGENLEENDATAASNHGAQAAAQAARTQKLIHLPLTAFAPRRILLRHRQLTLSRMQPLEHRRMGGGGSAVLRQQTRRASAWVTRILYIIWICDIICGYDWFISNTFCWFRSG